MAMEILQLEVDPMTHRRDWRNRRRLEWRRRQKLFSSGMAVWPGRFRAGGCATAQFRAVTKTRNHRKMKTTTRQTILVLALLALGSTSLLAAGSAISSSDRPATVVASATPVYPYLLRHAGATAEVTVLFTVNAKGTVTRATIVDSNNFEFNASSLEAIRKWTFTPATKNGQPVEVRLKQTFTFNVRDLPARGNAAVQVAGGAR
jgi:TonB family protein